ncbi:pentapeptide repeat-containing protein [Lacinutrix neustonica]|uniref:Pentapeptide repeat-containing protein n=1 Tax=Lacinutrix neustonica TaxID=2980107 RepID=A0A9E8MYR2_9FLAO|nr:pentapeptide repeat-containing protein [Lacinutrix neustonica]WAC02982.1 pentapeptide repeat-containing protein [Lacinutrix neustonica]
MKTKKEILEYYQNGQRFYRNVDFDNGESYADSNFQDAMFENCYFGVEFSNSNFRNARFSECNLKSTDFSNCDLTKTEIFNCLVEAIDFGTSDTSSLIFESNTSFGNEVKINTKSNGLEAYMHPLIEELYKNVPDFDKISDHTSDDLLYSVFGDLSLRLSEQITELEKPNKLITDSFTFFNHLGNKNDKEIDNLLVVGIYEGLYWSKKCNDLSRSLLKGRNKEVYEYWMINGNIQAEY